MRQTDHELLSRLEAENAALQSAVRLLHRVGTLVRESPELEPTCYALLTGVTAGVGLGLNRAMLFFVDDLDRGLLRGVAAVGPADGAEADRIWKSIEADAPDLVTLYQAGLKRRAEPSALDRAVRATTLATTDDNPVALALRSGSLVRGQGTQDVGGLLHLPTCIAAPLRGRESISGVLYADNRFTGRSLDGATELVLSLIADHAGRAIEQAHHFERVARQARTDSLTELEHHGTMMHAVRSAVERAGADGTQLGLAMIDLDDFKRVNDTFGHLAGDALLAGVAARLRSVLRVGERPYRYGGEEFAVLVHGAEPSAMPSVGERLRACVAESVFRLGADRTISVTCSVGVAPLRPGDDAARLIDAADQALLEAKAQGKNRVQAALG